LERKRGLRATEVKSIWKLEQVLGDHLKFVAALARFLALDNHSLVYVLGNHDREFHFPGVQRGFVRSIADQLADVTTLCSRITFEPWFYYVPGEIYVEHGQQYDFYTSFRHVLQPTTQTREGEMIALPMGNLSNRYLMSQMGFFNPHAGDYILNLFSYAWHWLRYYAFSRRGIALNWFFGSLLVLARLLRTKREIHATPPGYDEMKSRLCQRSAISETEFRQIEVLQHPPITNRVYRIVREFWIDRLIVALLMTSGTITLALVEIPLWIKLMVPLSSFPLLYLIYEWFAHGETVRGVEQEIRRYGTEIARILLTPLVVFGHTHAPQMFPIGEGVTFVNTGTWAPIFSKNQPGELLPGLRNTLWVHTIVGRAPEVQLTSQLPLPNRPRGGRPRTVR
jgi:predicted phosphodiesterase